MILKSIGFDVGVRNLGVAIVKYDTEKQTWYVSNSLS